MAVGLGLKAIEHGYRVLFTTAAAMLTTLTKALGEGRFDDKLKVFTIPRLLIIDEIGYLPTDRQAATLFFQLISRRYERGPMILTSNQSFGSWGDVFGDRVIASAILDRILHHATTISIRGDSYRLKDKLKSGVVKPTTAGAMGSLWTLPVPWTRRRAHRALDRPQTACPQRPQALISSLYKPGVGEF